MSYKNLTLACSNQYVKQLMLKSFLMAEKIDEKTVHHIAKLARLSLTDDEVKSFSHDLSELVQYVEQLQELDTKDVEPMVGAVDLLKELRQDSIVESKLRDAMLKNAPDAEETAIKVPQMS